MFGIDFSEILVIFGIALVVLGPEKLPKLAATIGRWVGRARLMARQFREQLEQEASSLQRNADLNSYINPDVPPPGTQSTPAAPSTTAAPATAAHATPETPFTPYPHEVHAVSEPVQPAPPVPEAFPMNAAAPESPPQPTPTPVEVHEHQQ